MKNLIIDTNILYHYFGDEQLSCNKNGTLNYSMLIDELDKYAKELKLFIPTISLMEIVVHFRNNPIKIKEILDFIVNKNINYIDNTVFKFNSLDIIAIFGLPENELKVYIYKCILHQKIIYELEYIFMFIILVSIPLLFSLTSFNVFEQNKMVEQILESKLTLKNLFISSNYNILYNAYKNDSEKTTTKDIFKKGVNDFIISCLQEYCSNIKKFNYETKQIIEILDQTNLLDIMSNILSKKNNKIYRDNLFNEEMDKLFINCGYNQYQTYHIKKIAQKFLKNKNDTIFKKNDIEDLTILGFKDANNLLLTLDKSIKETLFNLDKSNYNFIQNFLLCKK